MHSLFLDPAREGQLAKCAVCYVIALFMSFVIPALLCGAAVFLIGEGTLLLWLSIVIFFAWAWWMLRGTVKAVRLLKTASSIETSSAGFHAIQAMAVVVFLFFCYFRRPDYLNQINDWVFMVQVFLVFFYAAFFSFGLLCGAKLPDTSWLGFLILVGSLLLR